MKIDHGDGTYSRYLHCNEVLVSTGQTVNRGDVIGTVGGWGEKGPDSYADHLHLEICHGDPELTYSNEDPLDFFPKMKASVSVGEQLVPR